MNSHLSFVVEDQHDDFKKVPGSVGSEHQETVGRVVIAEIVDNELMFDGMTNVAIGAAVLAGRSVDLHRAIVIRMTGIGQAPGPPTLPPYEIEVVATIARTTLIESSLCQGVRFRVVGRVRLGRWRPGWRSVCWGPGVTL